VVDPDGDAESLHFAPSATTVQVGQSVSWTMEANSREVHTVTFLSGAPLIPLEQVTENPNGPPTIAVNPMAAAPAGGSSYNGTGFANSGLMMAGDTYSLTFTEPGTYEYYCIVHGELMEGTVTVTAAAAAAPSAPPSAPPSTTPPSAQAPAANAPAAQVPAAMPATGDGSTLIDRLGTLALPALR
jgi:plastocyanin